MHKRRLGAEFRTMDVSIGSDLTRGRQSGHTSAKWLIAIGTMELEGFFEHLGIGCT